MKILKKLSYLYLPALVISSCSQEDNNGLIVPDDGTISFVLSMPGVSSRAYNVGDSLVRNGFSVSAFCPDDQADADGILDKYCEDAIAVMGEDGIFRSGSCRWPGNSDDDGQLKFFAFHPSRAEMRTLAGEECFNYSNLTTKNADGIKYDYRLTKFRVASDISRQVDFVTAIGEGNKTANIYNDIPLNFEHQLCGVEIGVWGASSLYDVEVAGVRIGGIVVEADFNLATEVENPVGNENSIGSWLIPDEPERGHVDYVYTTGDKVVTIDAVNNNTKETATSVMGNGGKAMVIPSRYEKWDYKNDKTNDSGAYISVLLRMTERAGDQHVIFPSTDPDSRSSLVFLVVSKSDGMVMQRLSADQYDSYTAADGEEKRAYGWAAVPANVDWKAGYTYSYVLDYSVGVGVHDPADNNPAIPIIDYDGVEIIPYTPKYGKWGDGEIIKIDGGSWGANSNNTAADGTIWWK